MFPGIRAIRLGKRRLAAMLAAFFLLLAIPFGLLVSHAFGQLKWEAFHQHQVLARELSQRIGSRLEAWIAEEEGRSFADYRFLVVSGDPAAKFLQRSPLAEFPVKSRVPGLVGYFQIGPDGGFSTPLLPAAGVEPGAYGISAPERAARLDLQTEIRDRLQSEWLVRAAAVSARESQVTTEAAESSFAARSAALAAPTGRVAADNALESVATPAPAVADSAVAESAPTGITALGRVADLGLDDSLEKKAEAERRQQERAAVSADDADDRRRKRVENIVLPEQLVVLEESDVPFPSSGPAITAFESEVEPLEIGVFADGSLVLSRRVWREGERYVQGAVVDTRAFVDGVVGAAFDQTALSDMSRLLVAYRGNILRVFSATTPNGYGSVSWSGDEALLYRGTLAAPMDQFELVFSVETLPYGPAASLMVWLALIVAVVLSGGVLAFYRLGVGQIALARQQQDFVSAVSHELKTPLTSIRMYGEMLKSGWADEQKKASYYDFIHEESERLSRLIDNVLQLARMTRNELPLDIQPIAVGELLDIVKSRIASQVERAGFDLVVESEPATVARPVRVDVDCFLQVVINLVDNAIKFAADAERRQIVIAARPEPAGVVAITVRDFGSGIDRSQMRKIFKLFYRGENELTRETVGTGIGLALASELVRLMGGGLDVGNADPGAEFRISLPITDLS